MAQEDIRMLYQPTHQLTSCRTHDGLTIGDVTPLNSPFTYISATFDHTAYFLLFHYWALWMSFVYIILRSLPSAVKVLEYLPAYSGVWYRTLTTSNGCPTINPAAPDTQPKALLGLLELTCYHPRDKVDSWRWLCTWSTCEWGIRWRYTMWHTANTQTIAHLRMSWNICLVAEVLVCRDMRVFQNAFIGASMMPLDWKLLVRCAGTMYRCQMSPR